MEWITAQLPDDSMVLWLVIICVTLVALNVYQYARAHDLAGTIKHMLEHGHQPDGKVLVPADNVAHVIDEPRIVPPSQIDIPPWERKA